MKTTTLARIKKLVYPFTRLLSPKDVVLNYSRGRRYFLKKLEDESLPKINYEPPKLLGRTLWGLKFRSPIMNAAGMDKNFRLYFLFFTQGAGGYLGGTTTYNPRKGNEKEGLYLPFVAYRKSGAASNFLGLPNDGDEIISARMRFAYKNEEFATGISVMGSPDIKDEDERLEKLIEGMKMYKDIGFIEMNESCPNTSHKQDVGLESRLKFVKENFLDSRERKLPVIVKFSNDTEIDQVPFLLDLLFKFGFDGVNFGNTSTDYEGYKDSIDKSERPIYDYFTKTFKGGVSGRPLKDSSLMLASIAVRYLKKGGPKQEFHVIRTGGIENAEDIKESEREGISLNQWFTGYWAGFDTYHHRVYEQIYQNLLK